MYQQKYFQIENEYGAHNSNPLDVVLSRGEGVWVWDVDENKYLDCHSAYSAINQGHCHPKILRTMIEQVKRLTLNLPTFLNNQLHLFYSELCELTNSKKVLPINSGAEAVETAIKIVRKWGYMIKGVSEDQAEIIVCKNNFHGWTTTIVGFSTAQISKEDFGPFTPGFKVIPFGDAQALDKAISPNTVGFFVEPIQCEAGVLIPPDEYMKEIKAICEKDNVPLILDEIQTGLGRTGKFMAAEHDGIEADLTLIGGALCGGFYPISAVLFNNEELYMLGTEELGNTFSSTPLACAVARTGIKVLIDEKMVENAAEIGTYFLNELKKINSPKIKEVRGKGLMIGVELFPEAGSARQYCEKLKDKSVLCKETINNVIRLMPPLIIKKEEIDWALERIAPVLTDR